MPAGEYLRPIVQEFKGDTSGLVKAVGEADAAYDMLGRKSKSTAAGITKDGKDSEKAFTDFDRLLRSKLKDDETALSGFQRELTTARTKVTGLRTELQKSSGAESLGLFQDLKAAEADLKGLENIGDEIMPGFRKSMQNTGNQGGKDLAKSAEDGFGSGFSGTSIMGPVIAGLAIASPLIVAMLGSAVTAGLGAGTIAVGIAGAAHDPRVKAAFGGLEQVASQVFHSVTSPLIEPLTQGIHDLEADLNSAAPGLREMFSSLAAVTRPLIDGVGGFVTGMLPGLESGLEAAQPLLQDLAKLLPFLGEKVGEMFDEFGHAGPGARLALQALIGVVGGLAVGLGKVVDWSSELFLKWEEGVRGIIGTVAVLMAPLKELPDFLGGNKFKEMDAALVGAYNHLGDNIRAAEQDSAATNKNADSWNLFSASIAAVNSGLNDVINAQKEWISQSQAADDSNLAMHRAMSAFNKELLRGKKNWDLNTAAGQGNVERLDILNEAITRHYDDLLKLHPANKTLLQDELAAETALYKQALAAGASNDELATIKGTIESLHTQLGILNGTSATVTVHAKFVGDKMPDYTHLGKSIAFEHGGIMRADQGLVSGILPPRDPGTWVLAGERGTRGEVFMPLAGISRTRAMDLAQVAGDAYGFDAVPRARAYAGGGGTAVVHNHVHVYLDGREIHSNQIRVAQRYKRRTGTTGLT